MSCSITPNAYDDAYDARCDVVNIPPILLLVREPTIKERVASFDLLEIKIGTEKDADLRLADPSVSKRLNARIRRQDGELVLTNYSSAATVTVNGRVVNLQGVGSGDVIRVGEVDIVVAQATKLDPREQALVDDIVNDPADEMLRFVYADWLEENGFADRAQYLRLDFAVNKALKGGWGPKIREDIAILSGLTRSLPPTWLKLMRRRPPKP